MTTTPSRYNTGCECHRGRALIPIRITATPEYKDKIAETRTAREAELANHTYGMCIYPETK